MPPKRASNAKPDLPTLPFPTRHAFAAWLSRHHATSPGLWIKFAKRSSGIPSVTHPEALDLALCHGWIDGQVKRLDDHYYLHRFTPRTPRSRWSKVNRAHATRLIAAGQMTPAGLAQIHTAQSDGRWDAAYDPPRTATLPPDLAAALAAHPAAAAFFATLDSHNRYAILHRLQTAQKPETRARRLSHFLSLLLSQKKTPPLTPNISQILFDDHQPQPYPMESPLSRYVLGTALNQARSLTSG